MEVIEQAVSFFFSFSFVWDCFSCYSLEIEYLTKVPTSKLLHKTLSANKCFGSSVLAQEVLNFLEQEVSDKNDLQ